MAGPMDPNVSLDYYRGFDKEATNVEHETIPEKQALNARYVSDFLGKRGITPENFDKNFNLATAIDMTASQKSSAGSQEMFRVLFDSKAFLDQRGLSDLFENMNESTVKSNIQFELQKRNETDQSVRLQRGYNTYRVIKMYCDRMFKIREQFSDVREKEKTQVNKGVKEEFAGVMEGVKKNFGNLEGKEKMLVVVGGLIGAAMLMSSDSPRVAKIRETVWTCLKIGGFAWLGNTVFKVFTGKTALQTISDWSKSNTATEEFWTKTYKTNSEQAEILRQSTIYLGDMDIMRLAGEYQKARNLGKDEITLPTVRDMNPKQIYTSLDVFFKRYPVEKIMQKYAQVKPEDRTWRSVMGAEMIEDQSIQMNDSVLSQTADAIGGTATRLYNAAAPKVEAAVDYVASGKIGEGAKKAGKAGGKVVKGIIVGGAGLVGGVVGGVYEGVKGTGKMVVEGGKEVASDVAEVAQAAWAWVKDLFKRNFGTEGTDDEVLTWSKKALKNLDETQSGDLEKFIRENNPEKKKADGYVDAMRNGNYERVGDVDVKYMERDKGTSTAAIFISAGCTIPLSEKGVTEQGVLDAMKKSDAGARDFLKKKYPQIADKIDAFVEFSQGVYVVSDRSYKVFVRMPLPGTDEFNQRMSGRWTPEEMKSRKNIEIFGTDNKLEYGKLEPWEQNQLRLNFYLDASQTNELNAICDKYTRMYNTKGLPINVVKERFLNNTDDRDVVLAALQSSMKLDRKLYTNRGLLEARESDIQKIEENAQSKVVGSDDVKKAFRESVRLKIGSRVRLALLGDSESMSFYNYDPSSTDKTKLRTADDLLKVYENDLNQKAKEKNASS